MGGVLALGGADHADERIVQFEFAGAGPGEGKERNEQTLGNHCIVEDRRGIVTGLSADGEARNRGRATCQQGKRARRSAGSAVDTGGGGVGQSSRETIDPGGGARWFGSAHNNSSSNTVRV